MERMLSYCSTPSAALIDDHQFDHSQSTCESIDGFLNFDRNFSDDGGGGEIVDNQHSLGNLEKGVDHSYYSEQINSLVAQCNQYQNVIKRQENEIDYYRKHIESLEDDFSRMSSSLAAAEKNVNQYKKKLTNYEQTIDSLENELENIHSKISPSSQSLSLTNEIDFKIDNHDQRNFTWSTTNRSFNNVKDKISDHDLDSLLLSMKKFFDENIELKSQIELMKNEIERLKKDNEDYRLQLSDGSNSKFLLQTGTDPVDRYRMSTPIKNFISYQALNIPVNNSFSIDEDYECDNMIFDDNFKHFNFSAMAFANFGCKNQNQHNTVENSLSVSRLPSIDYIENEEMPSRMVRGDDISTVVGEKIVKSPLLIDSTLSLCDISNIENQKLPRSPIADLDSTCFSDYSEPQISSTTTHGGQLTIYDMNGNHESQLENDKQQLQMNQSSVEIKSESQKNKQIFPEKPLFISFFFLIYSTFIHDLKHKLLITKFRLILLLIISIFFVSYKWTRKPFYRFDQKIIETRLIPFYSIEEIFIELLTQFGFIG
ncbi:uncharacterized protein LOC113797931 [Dermatophagoides pteronyssinus]|uniref:uncharacterized protein LOC113797931 n=1 Tax=Dermatophagoides pteronyssinus TaxID=6956 RepID=UPI003F6797C6